MDELEKGIHDLLAAGVPADDAFWARQRAEIMGRVGPRRAPWRRWGAVTAAAGALAVFALFRPVRPPRSPIPPQDMELVQNLDLAENLDILEDLDVLEASR